MCKAVISIPRPEERRQEGRGEGGRREGGREGGRNSVSENGYISTGKCTIMGGKGLTSGIHIMILNLHSFDLFRNK